MGKSAKNSMKHDKICRLQGVYVTDSALYDIIYKSLEAPEWAGYNLDALFDILTTEIEGSIEIEWQQFDEVKSQDVSMNLAIADLMREAANERPDLSLTLI